MNLKRKAYASSAKAVGERQVRVICSTPAVDRAGEVVVQEGVDFAPYMQNPVVLFAHDPNQPIATVVEMGLDEGNLAALVQFPPAGVSTKADEVYGLVKAGVLNTVSVGFQPTELMAMDPEQPRGPQRYVKSELLELSFVSIPANRGATVVGRSLRAARPVVRSLYDIGLLASAMSQVGWCQESAVWEAEYEADGSKVPAMLGEAMQQLGAALVAMTEEEVAEILADLKVDVADTIALPPADVAIVAAAPTTAIRKFRAGWLRGRAAPTKAVPPVPVTKAGPAGSDRRRRAAQVAALG